MIRLQLINFLQLYLFLSVVGHSPETDKNFEGKDSDNLYISLYPCLFYCLFPSAIPHFLDFTLTVCSLFGCHHVDAHMRPVVVVELYSQFDGSPYFCDGCEDHTLKQFVLYRAVDALGHGILLRIAAFSHADGYSVPVQHSHISIGCVLTSAVRVVYKPSVVIRKMFQSHTQGFQCISYTIAYDFFRVGILEQREVAERIFFHIVSIRVNGNIGNIAHPQPVLGFRNIVPYQIREGGESMGGVRSARLAHTATHFQTMAIKDVIETVSSYSILIAEALVIHQPKFLASDSGIKLTYFLYELHDKLLAGKTAEQESVIMLVIRLPRYPKQFTNAAHDKF